MTTRSNLRSLLPSSKKSGGSNTVPLPVVPAGYSMKDHVDPGNVVRGGVALLSV